MPIGCLSVTHHSAPVALRERLSLPGAALEDALARAVREREAGRLPLTGVAILSTCNRLELYAEAPGFPAGDAELWRCLIGFLVETFALDAAAFASHLVCYSEAAAAEHLCRVAAGLDSMVLGESEILGQLAEAYETALRRRAVGPALSLLFRAALQTGKRVRSETAIGRSSGSVSSVAVELAAQAAGELSGKSVAVIGAGRMARKAARALLAHGSAELVVVNRSSEAATELAREWSGEARSFEQLPAVLARADIVISSTSASHTIIGAPEVRQAMAGRAGERPLVFIDIALPRDVDPLVREIPGVHLFDLDDLQVRLDSSLGERRKEVPRAEVIVAEEVRRFQERQTGREVLPIVKALRRKAEALRTRELARVLGQLPGADAVLRRRLEHFSQTLVNQLLHDPTRRLRAEAGNGHAAEYARIAGELFALGDVGVAGELSPSPADRAAPSREAAEGAALS